MHKEEKRKMFKPKPHAVYENGVCIGVFESHKVAKAVKHKLIVESYQDMLDLNYEVKPV